MRLKRFLLLMICLLSCLLLTACYQDNDPWPASNAPTEAVVTVAPETAAPANDATAVPLPTETAPVLTPVPDSEPGLNG